MYTVALSFLVTLKLQSCVSYKVRVLHCRCPCAVQVYYKRALARVEENREQYQQLLQAAMYHAPEGGEDGEQDEAVTEQPKSLPDQICIDLMASFQTAIQDIPSDEDHTPNSDGEGDSGGDTSPRLLHSLPQEATPPQRTLGSGFAFNVNAPVFKPTFDLGSLPD